ncbi:hypothetical protein GCM10027596_16500 [Nocardioides korecus]
MRKFVPVLFGLGGFLLVAGLVAALWAPGTVKKTPLDVNSTTRLSGQAQKLNTASGQLESNAVKATSITKADSKVSDGSVVAFTNSTCLVIDTGNPPACVDGKDPRLISASTDVFATDRKTALSVNSSKYLPSDATPHQGVVNKWPFDAQKRTYAYWDGTAGKAVDATFKRTATVRGLETYVYDVSVSQAPIDIAEGIKGTYDDSKQIYVDPRTGTIIDQKDSQQRALDSGQKVLDLKLDFTDQQVAANVKDTQDNIKQLDLVTRTVPLVGIVGGLVCLAAAVVLLVLRRRRD